MTTIEQRRARARESDPGTSHQSAAIERDSGRVDRDGGEPDGVPYMRVQYPTRNGYVDTRYRIPDREKGALKRLNLIMSDYPELASYVQGDPRGLPLYIGKREDMSDSTYNNGVGVCK